MKKAICSIGIGLGCVLATATASAQTATASRDCEAIRARAAGDAALLLSPSVIVEGVHYPSTTGLSTTIGGSISPAGYQIRGSLSWSPLDAFRSTLVRQLANTNCSQQIAMVEASQVLEQLNDVGKETALTNELEYLTSQGQVINDVFAQANKRLVAGTATILDLTTLQQTAASLEMRRVQAQGQLDALHAKKYVMKQRSFAELVAVVQDASMDYERRASSLHSLDAWKTSIQIGAIPPMTGGDVWSWAGYASVSYNFGGLFLNHNESQYLDYRSRELKNARYELTDQLTRFRDVVKASMVDMNRQMTALDSQMAMLTATYGSLMQHPDALGAQNAMALLQLQIVDVASNRVAAQSMLVELTKFYGEKE